MKAVLSIFWLSLAAFATLVNSQLAYEEGRKALSDSLPNSCDDILADSKFYGTCCALNTTASLGCVLNVANGWCRITGQFWTKTFNSTDDRITCGGSEHEVPILTTGSGFTGGNGDNSPAHTVTLLSASALLAGVTAFLF